MQTKEAIVLAGGLGTRLQNVLPDIPKCMAPVAGKPFLVYVLDYLESQGINKVILSVGYLKYQIINYIGNNYNSISIEYSVENEPLGTGGAVKFALGKCTQDEVFIVNGDTYFTPDLAEMENDYINSEADIAIAVKKMSETERYGLVNIDEKGKILYFKEKENKSGSGWINGGIYLLNRRIFNNFSQQKFSLEKDVFMQSSSSVLIHAYKSDAYFLDIGTPEDLYRAQLELKSITG